VARPPEWAQNWVVDVGTLESMVKPWWLSRPAFLVVMILVAVVAVGCVALEWYVERQLDSLMTLVF
jgi:hypothetical protein